MQTMMRPRRSAGMLAVMLAGAVTACSDAPVQPSSSSADGALASVGAPRGGYYYRSIDVPGAMWTAVMRMNARGDMVGSFRDATGTHGFLRIDDTYEVLHYPGAVATQARGINEPGTVVGSYSMGGKMNGFVLADGEYSTLNVPGANQTVLWDINANGVISGEYQSAAGGPWYAFVWRRGEFDFIEIPNATMSAGFGINLRGEVVGHYRLADPTQPGGATKMFGFVWRDGEVTQLDFPVPNGMSCAQGIGDQGSAVGHYADLATGIVHGYVWRGGSFTGTLRVPDAHQTYPLSMTPNGVVAGYYLDATWAQHGFVAEPLGQPGH